MQMADRHTHSLPSPKLNQQAQDSPSNEGVGAGGRSMKGDSGGPAGGRRRPERAGGRRRWTIWWAVVGKEAAALWAERIRSGRNGGERRGDGTERRGQMQKAQGTVG